MVALQVVCWCAYSAMMAVLSTVNNGSVIEALEARRLLAVQWDGPITITRGGTYKGNWHSNDVNVPAVTIRTTEPVIITHSHIRARGDLVVTRQENSKVTIRKSRAYGLNPNVRGKHPGRFFSGEFFDDVRIEDNILTGTSGIHLNTYRGWPESGETVKVLRNVARNIDGRLSDGRGGYYKFNVRRRISDGLEHKGYHEVQFVQLDKVRDVPGMEIAWNEIINEPGNSRVEDVISVFKSGGTPESPLSIHNNYIQGAYTIAPTRRNYVRDGWEYDWGYTGGGIMLGDIDASYVVARHNHVVNTTNYGIAIAAGHDIRFENNRIISSGRLPDGTLIPMQNVGAYIWNPKWNKHPFYNNRGSNNLIGWVKGHGRNDWWTPDAERWEGNRKIEGAITISMEQRELKTWRVRRMTAR